MNRASGDRARYRHSTSRRRFQPVWILAGGVLCAVGLLLDYPVFEAETVKGGALALLALLPLVIGLTVRPGAGRARSVTAAGGVALVLAGYAALLYDARYAPHDGYSVTITSTASISEVQTEIQAISGSHGLAADTSFSGGRIKVAFPGGDAATIAATVDDLRRAQGISAVEACYGTLC